MRRSLCAPAAAALFFLALATPAGAHEFFSTKITWSREISRIVAKSCLGCHREGGKAFSLATYEEARPWAKAIKEEVLYRRMPPWGAVKGFGHFQGDKGLSQDEIGLIGDWVEGGAPEGDKIYLPKMAPPAFGAPVAGRRGAADRLLNPALPLPSRITVRGIAPKGAVPAGSRVVAELPDGTVEPLIWVLDPKAAVQREFLFETPLTLPAGTRFSVSAQSGGQWRLLLAATSP